MRTLVVGPYPPLRDGVGTYALQEVIALKKSGHDVQVLSPMPTAAHHHVNLKGGFRLMRLRRFSRSYDQIILHYQPSHYHLKGGGISRLLSNLGLLLTFASIKNLRIVCHEVEYPSGKPRRWHPLAFLAKEAWNRVRGEVIFHSERELQLMRNRLGADPKRATIRPHDLHFNPHFEGSRAEARDSLGISQSTKLLLCVGFVQPHKGFDRAMRAFSNVPAPDAALAVVGSVRTNERSDQNYARLLGDLASADRRIDLRIQVLSDEEFDKWIVASDLVILPYLQIWSSSVMARAKLLERPVLATDVGGVPDQAGPADTIVRDDRELTEAIARFLGVEARIDADVGYEDAVRIVDSSASSQRLMSTPEMTALPKLPDREALLESLLRRPTVIPSSRPVLGPVVTIIKKVSNKVLGRLFDARIESQRVGILALLERIESLEDRLSERDRSDGLNPPHQQPPF